MEHLFRAKWPSSVQCWHPNIYAVLSSHYSIHTIQLHYRHLKFEVRKWPKNRLCITVLYDGWAFTEHIACRQENPEKSAMRSLIILHVHWKSVKKREKNKLLTTKLNYPNSYSPLHNVSWRLFQYLWRKRLKSQRPLKYGGMDKFRFPIFSPKLSCRLETAVRALQNLLLRNRDCAIVVTRAWEGLDARLLTTARLRSMSCGMGTPGSSFHMVWVPGVPLLPWD